MDWEILAIERARELFLRAERIRERFVEGVVVARGAAGAGQGGPALWPPINVLERPGAIEVLAAVPGVSAGEITVRIERGDLVIEGVRRCPEMKGADLRLMEIPCGRFERRLALPRGALQIERAALADGFLRVTLRPTVAGEEA